MKVFRKHFNLINKVPDYIELQGQDTLQIYRVPYFNLKEYCLGDLVKEATDAFFEARHRKAYVYSATDEEGQVGYLLVTNEECMLLGQDIKE